MVVLLISNIITLTLYVNSKEDSNIPNMKAELYQESNSIEGDFSSYYFMTNPVDQYFSSKMCQNNISQVELRDLQDKYYFVWKNEYQNILKLIKNKCIKEQDNENYKNFIELVDSEFQTIKPLLLNEILDNYNMEDSPEKQSIGNGTTDLLKLYQGMIYRNACMLFIPYLKDEYKFPTVVEME